MRLASARNVFIYRTHGSRIPFDVIRSTLEGWGRFTLVETPDKADLMIEISSSGDSSVQVSSSSSVSAETGQRGEIHLQQKRHFTFRGEDDRVRRSQ